MGATDSLAPYVVAAVAAGALAGLGLKIRDALTYLGLVLGGAWTLVDIWTKVQDNDDDREKGCYENFKSQKNDCERKYENCRRPGSGVPALECQARRARCITSAWLDYEACKDG